MAETRTFQSQLEASDLESLIFARIPYETMSPGSNFVLRKMRAAGATNPFNNEEWLALGSKWALLSRGRYERGESILMFRATGSLLQMYVNLDTGMAHGEYELADGLVTAYDAIDELGSAASVFEFLGEPINPEVVLNEYRSITNGNK